MHAYQTTRLGGQRRSTDSTACSNKFRHDRDGWLEAVSVSDWIMALPHDSDYTSPFHMQGCVFP